MILSTVNFVNNYKFSDYILDRITEEQSERDEELRRIEKRHSVCTTGRREEGSPKKRSPRRLRHSGDFSSVKKDAQQMGTSEPEVDSPRCVTIETSDGYYLAVDQSSLHISLKEGVAETNINNVFRLIDIEAPEIQGTLSVFQLHSNPSYYLATNHDRHLQLQSYCADTLDADCPDERFFYNYQFQDGVHVLQPCSHKGLCLHHIDNFLNIRPLEINFRPPEEFYFNINTVNARDIRFPSEASSASGTLTPESGDKPRKDKKSAVGRRWTKKEKKDKGKATKISPITPKPSVLSCFGLSRRKKGKNKR